jgi:ribose transport system substrate-binding protein
MTAHIRIEGRSSMSRRRFAVGAAVLAVAALSASAAQARHDTAGRASTAKKTLNIYLIPGISTDAFYTTMHKGAMAAAKKLGVNLTFQGSPTAFSAPTQIPILNAAIARKPDAILIAPTDKTALIAPIKNAINAGIPVATVDTFITKPLAFTNISSDNVAGGKQAAIALARSIGFKGTVAAVSVQPGISTTDQRQQGFEQQIKTYKNIHYVGTQYDNDSATKAAQIMSGLLRRYSDLKGVFAMNVISGEGVTTATNEAGKSGKVKLVEFDAEPDQVKALKKGTIDALIAQDPYTIGYMGVQEAVKYVNGQKSGIAKHYGTGEAIITRANVGQAKIKKFLYTK